MRYNVTKTEFMNACIQFIICRKTIMNEKDEEEL